ncbi:MAG TPA: alkyl sulfatase dimerization domain-containing protein [Microthrixaceae bacterium]|nr:alkyl sulfatase dimerization domain-containing protein [Microthrixaceae bacterium]
MGADPLEISENILSGRVSIQEHSPLSIRGGTSLTELHDGLAFVESFGNVTALLAGDSLVLIDAGGVLHAGEVHRQVRQWSNAPLHTAVYTHGHVGHVFAVPLFEAENNGMTPRVVAHENVPRRFDRYKLTQGYNGRINQRQFRLEAPMFPDEFRYPDTTYVDEMTLQVEDLRIELHHDKGETDDGTWAWFPDRKLLCTGDLFIWAAPNCGNPQKVQRFPWEWACALRKMSALGAELMLPGHGLPIAGAEQIRVVLSDTAELLESLHSQSLELMNAGARLDDLIHTVRVPEHLTGQPWLQPIYDDPEFIVRNLWRLYGGWYDGNPATLKPAPERAIAHELVALLGGAGPLVDRAVELSEAGNHRLACQLIEFAALSSEEGEAGDPGVHRVRAEIYRARARVESSLMAKGVYRWAQAESDKLLESE